MYKQAFYITLAAPKDSGEKYIFKKVSGWGERFPCAVHTFAGLPSFDGGCGVSCFREIFEVCGYEWKQVASGNTFNAYTLTCKQQGGAKR